MWSGRWSTGTGSLLGTRVSHPRLLEGQQRRAQPRSGRVRLSSLKPLVSLGSSEGDGWTCLLGTPGVAHSGTHDECSLERLNPQVITPSWVRPPLYKEWGRRQGLLFHGYRVLVF